MIIYYNHRIEFYLLFNLANKIEDGHLPFTYLFSANVIQILPKINQLDLKLS